MTITHCHAHIAASILALCAATSHSSAAEGGGEKSMPAASAPAASAPQTYTSGPPHVPGALSVPAPRAEQSGEQDRKTHAGAKALDKEQKLRASDCPFGSAIYPTEEFNLCRRPRSDGWRMLYDPAQDARTDVGNHACKLLMHNGGERAVVLNAYNYLQILHRIPGDKPAYRAFPLEGYKPGSDTFCAMSPDGSKLLSYANYDNIIKLYTLKDTGAYTYQKFALDLHDTLIPPFFEDNEYFKALDCRRGKILSLTPGVTPRKETKIWDQYTYSRQFSYYKLGIRVTLHRDNSQLLISPDHDNPVEVALEPKSKPPWIPLPLSASE